MESLPGPDEDFALARAAFEAGEMAHAARHVSNALAVDPSVPAWRALLEEIAEAGGDPKELIDIEQGAYFGHVAGHAYLLAHQGRVQEGLDLLAQVGRHMPAVPYGTWAADWLRTCRARLHLGGTAALLAHLGRDTIGFMELRASERAVLSGWLPLAEAILERDGSDLFWPGALLVASGLLRRLGRFAAAEDAARRAMALEPSGMASTALGLALRAAGRYEEALEAFRAAQEQDPDTTFAAERARVLLDAGRPEEAWRELSSVEGREEDPELSAMHDYLGHAVEGRPSGEAVVRILGPRARADDFRRITVPAATALALPNDATANAVRQVFAEHGHSVQGRLRVSVTHLEPPSCRLALVVGFQGTTDTRRADYSFGELPDPDPRRPRRPVRDVVWIYTGEGRREVVQAVAPPSERVQRLVTAIATSPYYLPRWWDAAKSAGPGLGPRLAEELLGAMVHPPVPPPDDTDAVEWIFRHQCAAALLLAHVDEGWEGSRRREALLSLVDGVVDWTTDAAILALRELALDEPAALGEVSERFWTLLDELPSPGHTWYGETLAWSYLCLPGTPADRQATFRRFLSDLYEPRPALEDGEA
ncbi:MAG: tetratricopeptide repeat protein [Planctomycetota bacterium]|nr:MAG: tetratricopeptide repeat protein [Planctomycetota bacterium]